MADLLAIDTSETLGADVTEQVLLIATDMIDQGERLRPVDPVFAGALGQVMLREKQRTPIEVCRLPGANRWTLVAGAHRHAGAISAGIEWMRAIVVSADRDDRRLREVSENLWRRDLAPIDRAAFVAEAVAIHKRRAGIDPKADGRVASAAARWQKAIKNEADDANVTMTFAYGFTDAVAAELGLSPSTVARDLVLFRRLPPSLVAKLRDARHPVLGNAAQLRALAKLDELEQRRTVQCLLDYPGIGSVAQARAHLGGGKPVADPEAKRLSAFIGAFHRMGLAERKGALAHLRDLLPAGFTLVEGDAPKTTFPIEHQRHREETLEQLDAALDVLEGLIEDEVVDGERAGDVQGASMNVRFSRFTIAGNGFELKGAQA
jgi:hypothetical protein